MGYSGKFAQNLRDSLLDGVTVPLIARGGDVPMTRDGEKSSVLARAIVMDAGWFFAQPDHFFRHGLVAHGMGPAGEILLAKPQSREPCRHTLCMHRFARMGRAGKRNFL